MSKTETNNGITGAWHPATFTVEARVFIPDGENAEDEIDYVASGITGHLDTSEYPDGMRVEVQHIVTDVHEWVQADENGMI